MPKENTSRITGIVSSVEGGETLSIVSLEPTPDSNWRGDIGQMPVVMGLDPETYRGQEVRITSTKETYLLRP